MQWEQAADQLTRDAATLRTQALSLPPLADGASSEARERRARMVGLLDGTQSTLAELRVAMARAASGLAQMATQDPENTNELMREESARIDDSLEQLRQQMHIVGQRSARARRSGRRRLMCRGPCDSRAVITAGARPPAYYTAGMLRLVSPTSTTPPGPSAPGWP